MLRISAGLLVGILAASAALTSAAPMPAAQAQDFPSRPVTMVVPYGAGSPADVIGRLIAQGMSTQLGQQVLVENVGGAGGVTGVNRVAKASPDGYQFVQGGTGTHAQSQTLYKNPPYNAVADFTPLALITESPLVLVARKDYPADDLKGVAAQAKAKEATYGSAGVGSSTHLGCEMLAQAMGAKMTHVPYRGMPQALTDVTGGQIDCVFADPASAQGLVQDGKLRALAVTSAKRLETMPELPTIAESGLPGYELTAWVGVFVRAKTPAEIIARLNTLVTGFVNSAEAKKYLTTIGATPFPSTPQELAAFQEADTRRWAEIVATAKIEKK